MMLERAGVDSRWFPAATWARWSPGPRPGDALVVITHTGQTGYAARARAEALASGVPVVSITGTGPGWPEAITTVAAGGIRDLHGELHGGAGRAGAAGSPGGLGGEGPRPARSRTAP